MDVECVRPDRISVLPRKVIDVILTLLPIRDAVRTSILSRTWRYRWVTIPKLLFDYKQFESSTNDNKLPKSYKLFYAIYQVLLLHQGPVLQFSLTMPKLGSCWEIDQIILHLLRINTVEKLTIAIDEGKEYYKLPSSIFSMQQLTHLSIHYCAFKHPSTFSGFSKLTSLYFYEVHITAKSLQLFISNCPLLKSFVLVINYNTQLTGGTELNFVELFKCLPIITYMCMNYYPIKCFAAGGVPRKLPTSLFHLNVLQLLSLCFMEEDELSSVLLLIRSSPNLKKIFISVHNDVTDKVVSQNPIGLLELHDFSDVSLDHLNEFEMSDFGNLMPESEFLRLVLVKSPVLKTVRIKLGDKVTIDEELKMLKYFLRLPRASSAAEFIVERE